MLYSTLLYVYELVVILKDAGHQETIGKCIIIITIKSEIVPHNIVLAFSSTGSHILITLDGCWLITLLYTFKWLSKAASLCLVSVWTACGTSTILQL